MIDGSDLQLRMEKPAHATKPDRSTFEEHKKSKPDSAEETFASMLKRAGGEYQGSRKIDLGRKQDTEEEKVPDAYERKIKKNNSALNKLMAKPDKKTSSTDPPEQTGEEKLVQVLQDKFGVPNGLLQFPQLAVPIVNIGNVIARLLSNLQNQGESIQVLGLQVDLNLDQSSIKMLLHPKELGPLQVIIEQDKKEIKIQLWGTQSAKILIEDYKQDLITALQAGNLSLTQLDVSVGQGKGFNWQWQDPESSGNEGDELENNSNFDATIPQRYLIYEEYRVIDRTV